MAPTLKDITPTPIRGCGHSPDSKSDEVCGCPRLDERAASECWPRLRSHHLDQDDVDNRVSRDGLKASYPSLELQQSLLDTQRNSTNSQAVSEKITAILQPFDEDLPDTQRNVLDHENTLIIPAGSQFSGTRRSISQDMQIDEGSVDHQNQFLQGSQTQLLDVEHDQGTMAVVLDPQLADTQRNEFPDTSRDIPANDNPKVYLPDTQPNSPQWMPSVPSTTTLPTNQGSLISDTQRKIDSLEAIAQSASSHMQLNLTQSNTILADTQFSSVDNPELPSLADISFLKPGTDSKSPQTLPKVPHNKVNCRERKRIIVSSSRPPALTKAMCQWVDKTNYLLDPFREEDECWFHPSPPPAHLSMNGAHRPCGKLQKRFNWKDRHGKHSLVLNFGIACKLVNYKMTKQQKDGFINKQWHLSHLCGNWTCLNSAHTTVEPGNVNISRNNCFSHRSGCLHNPPCMKDKKVPLGADGKLVDHTASMASNFIPVDADDWDDWSVQGFDDGDDFIMADDNEESDVTDYNQGGDSFLIIDKVEEEL